MNIEDELIGHFAIPHLGHTRKPDVALGKAVLIGHFSAARPQYSTDRVSPAPDGDASLPLAIAAPK
jgi:hypothetical protein